MATATISPDQNTVNAEIFIAAPLERVYQALTDPAQTPRWWGQEGLYRVTESTADFRVGGKWSSKGVGADGTTFSVEGEYLELNPPRLIVQSWISSYALGMNTVVRWELEPAPVLGLHPSGPKKAGMGTLLKIRHDGFAGFPQQAASHGEGWKRVLGWLNAFLETETGGTKN